MNIQHYEIILTARETNGQSHTVVRIVPEVDVRCGDGDYLARTFGRIRHELHAYLSTEQYPGLLPK